MAGRRSGGRASVGWILVLATAVASLELTQPVPATGQTARTVRYTDTGLDPDDVPVDHTSCCQQDPDIRQTTRKVWVDEQNRWWVTISFMAYGVLDDYWTVRVRLDARGGPRYDATMVIFDSPPAGCTFRRRGSDVTQQGSVRLTLRKAFCRVPRSWLEPKKWIRWRLFSRGGGEGTGPAIDEYAPDNGWFV